MSAPGGGRTSAVATGELEKLARVRAARQLLHRPAASRHPADVLRAIAGAQAQELPAGRLSIRSRNAKLTLADVEAARTDERSIVRLWAMRNTAHLIATDDLPWIRPLFAPLMTAFNRRRLADFGVDAAGQDHALSLIRGALERDGPLTRTELSDRLQAGGLLMDSSRRVHIFPLVVSTGLAHLGAGDGGSTQLVLAGDWIPARKDADREAALAELARRYFAAFGPATEADFAGWAGLPLRDIRAGMSAIAGELRRQSVPGSVAWQPKRRAPRPVAAELVRLLPAYDTYLMGHRDREFIAAGAEWPEIGPGGGILRPTITVGGQAAGTWRLRRAGGRLSSELLPFGRLGAPAKKAIAAELDDIERFEGRELSRS